MFDFVGGSLAEVISILWQRFTTLPVFRVFAFITGTVRRISKGTKKKCGYFEEEESYRLPSCSGSAVEDRLNSKVSLFIFSFISWHTSFLELCRVYSLVCFLSSFTNRFSFLALFLNSLISDILIDQQIHSGVSVEYL